MEQSYDVIVVGGGSAGCVVASRLSEDPQRKVLLLEAGPDPQPIPEMVAKASMQGQSLLESPYLMMYPTERADGSTFYKVSGRIMGGGSSVNAMAAPRPTRYDFDTWVSHGNPDWSYEKCLPYLKRLEADQDFPESPIHGFNGPLYIKRPWTFEMPADPPVLSFVAGAEEMGLPRCPDLNGPEPYGICTSPYTIKNGYRQSTVVAYLDPARNRPNLTIVSEAQVTSLKVVGRRVQEVAYVLDGATHSASADRVVLSAGAYHSPQLLMLSGIGPAKVIEPLGIKMVHELDGVGENYQDHASTSLTFEARGNFHPDWIIPRFRLMYRSDPNLPCGNFHMMMRPPTEVPGLKTTMSISASLLEQHNRGRVYLNSADPFELPGIEAHMLEHPADREAMSKALQFIYELAQTAPLKEFYGGLVHPAPEDDWLEFACQSFSTYFHGSGTCMMGPASNKMAVVGENLQVHGMDNLWVADASIMPTVVHANTNVTSIMIGERLADFVKACS